MLFAKVLHVVFFFVSCELLRWSWKPASDKCLHDFNTFNIMASRKQKTISLHKKLDIFRAVKENLTMKRVDHGGGRTDDASAQMCSGAAA